MIIGAEEQQARTQGTKNKEAKKEKLLVFLFKENYEDLATFPCNGVILGNSMLETLNKWEWGRPGCGMTITQYT